MAKNKKKVPVTREDAVTALYDRIENWDILSLVEYVQAIEEERLEKLSNENLAWEYDLHCNLDDDTTKTVILEQTKATKVLYEQT